jgi:branched-chain amino acid transport system substrate-binding protein
MNRSQFALTTASAFALGTGQAVAQGNAPYKIGLTWPLTGSLATFVAEVMKGGEVAVDEINKAGGIKGHPIQLVVEDSAGTPQGGITAMRKLVQVDGVQVVSTILTNVVTAQIPLAEQFKVPALSQIETPGLLDKTTYCFAHAPTWGLIVPMIAADWKKRGIKRVYGMMLNNALGLLEGPACRAAAQSIGAEYGEALLDQGVTDFRGVAERVVNFGADAVVVPGQGGQVELSALRQLREMNTKALVYSLGQNYTSKSVIDAIGPYTEGMIFGGLYVSPSKAQKFVSAYKAKTGYIPSTQAEEQYDIIKMLAWGIEKAGYNGEGVARALAGMKGFPTVFGGTVDMGENHRTIIKALGLFQVQHGQLTRIASLPA